MTKLPSKIPDHHKYLFQCDCSDTHYIEVTWDDQDADWRYLTLTDTYSAWRLRDRLQAMWTVFRRKPHYHSGILLDQENTDALYKVLRKHCTWSENVLTVPTAAEDEVT